MAGIIHKIEETLGMGGAGGDHKKEAEKHKDAEKKHEGQSGEKKEGVIEKIKDKIHGDGGAEHGNKEEKKKKKKKKEKKHGGDHSGGDSSSGSDSD